MNRQSLDTFQGAEQGGPAPWWTPSAHMDRRPFLLARAKIAAALRHRFDAQGFLEVEPTCLQVSPGAETHLSAFATQMVAPDGRRREVWLHASPEFACKKLLAAGETKIVSLCRVFRNSDCGPLHLPEFTMLEWYRAHEPLEAVEADCLDALRAAAQAIGAASFQWKEGRADPFAPAHRLSVSEAFSRFAQIDLPSCLDDRGVGRRDALAAQSERLGIRVAPDDSWSDVFSKILSARIEPQLGFGQPTILYDYPLPEAALARPCPADPRFVERFELYCCGVELANAFGELTDSEEQRRRLEAAALERRRIYGDSFPIDEEFLAALSSMPPASGCALGFDRLVALAAGATRLDQVAWVPVPSPESP